MSGSPKGVASRADMVGLEEAVLAVYGAYGLPAPAVHVSETAKAFRLTLRRLNGALKLRMGSMMRVVEMGGLGVTLGMLLLLHSPTTWHVAPRDPDALLWVDMPTLLMSAVITYTVLRAAWCVGRILMARRAMRGVLTRIGLQPTSPVPAITSGRLSKGLRSDLSALLPGQIPSDHEFTIQNPLQGCLVLGVPRRGFDPADPVLATEKWMEGLRGQETSADPETLARIATLAGLRPLVEEAVLLDGLAVVLPAPGHPQHGVRSVSGMVVRDPQGGRPSSRLPA